MKNKDMKKRILAIVLCLVMVAGICGSALAEGLDAGNTVNAEDSTDTDMNTDSDTEDDVNDDLDDSDVDQEDVTDVQESNSATDSNEDPNANSSGDSNVDSNLDADTDSNVTLDNSAGNQEDVTETTVWEKELPTLTSVYADDLIAVATSQLGCTADIDGAVFIAECLAKAEIPKEKFPQEDNAVEWIAVLSSEDYDLFVPATVSADEYEPWIGDLIFLNTDEGEEADQIGILAKTAEGKLTLILVQDGHVQEVEYEVCAEQFVGYGMLPINMVDENGEEDEGALYEEETTDTVVKTTGHEPDTTIPYPDVTINKDEIDAPEDSEILELGKVIDENGDDDPNTFWLTLDAFATGETTEVTTVSPMDITLVLDRSGSMVQAKQFLTVDISYGLEEGCTYYDYRSSDNSKYNYNIPTLSDDADDASLYWNKNAGKLYAANAWGLSCRKPNPITYCECESCFDHTTGKGKWVKELSTYTTDDGEQLYEVLGTTEELEAKVKNGDIVLFETNMQATERALKTYIATLRAQGEAYNIQHRVAIVSYANSYGKGYTMYANKTTYTSLSDSTYVKTAYMKVKDDAEEIEDAINRYANLSYSGNNTPTHRGMQAAHSIRNKTWVTDNANGVAGKPMIVLFADGAPGVSTKLYEEWSNKALQYAERIKDFEENVPIYVVGLYDSAGDFEVNGYTPAQSDYYKNSDRFFEYLSSNFDVTLQTDDTYFDEISGNTGNNENDAVLAAVPNEQQGYFYPATSPSALANAFVEIAISSDTKVSTSVTLDETTILRDQITQYFEHYCTCGATDSTKHTCIEVYTVDWDGSKFADEEDWNKVYPGASEDPDIATGKIGVTVSGKSIDVTGFSYKDYPVVEGIAGGKKIVLKLAIETEEGFWGGNNVPTNEAPTNKDDGTGTAIYYNNKVIEAFPVPEANVPLHVNIDVLDKTIYYGGDISAKDLLEKITAGYKTTVDDFQGDPNDSIANLTVGITYDETTGTYTFTPAESWMDDYAALTWTADSTVYTTDITNKSDSGRGYEFEIVMTPIKAGTENLSGNTNPTEDALAGTVVSADGLTDSDTGYVYILVPQVEFQDSVINFGFIPNDNYYKTTNKVTADAEEIWVIDGNFTEEPETGDDDPTTYPAVSSPKPELTYTYTIASESKSFVQDTPINVSVTSSIVDGASGDITNATTFFWKCAVDDKEIYHQADKEDIDTHNGSKDDYEFWIHVQDAYELPSTGGEGIYLYLIAGVLLLMGGSTIIYKKRCKEVLSRR